MKSPYQGKFQVHLNSRVKLNTMKNLACVDMQVTLARSTQLGIDMKGKLEGQGAINSVHIQIHIGYRNIVNFVDILDIEIRKFHSVIHRGIAVHMIKRIICFTK